MARRASRSNDWRASLEHALALQPDHVSAYALIVEDGTAFARQVRRGEIQMPDDDETADKYMLADDLLTAAGFGWYELSNWARDEAARCQHNVLYWNSDDWFGIGPGAHSHVAGERWWNVKHPVAYAQRLAAGESPRMDGESIDADTAQVERVMLQTRLRSGHPVTELSESARDKLPDLVGRDLITLTDDRLVLTLTGRLLADAVVRELT